MGSGPGVMRLEVLTNYNGGVVYWAPHFDRFNPTTLKNNNNMVARNPYVVNRGRPGWRVFPNIGGMSFQVFFRPLSWVSIS